MRYAPLIVVLACGLGAAAATPRTPSIDDILDAIQEVETGGAKDPAHAVGDGGRSRGWLQIGPAYYADALGTLHDAGLTPPPYRSAVADRLWSRTIARAYLTRYAPHAVAARDARTLARVHNGGPAGPSYKATIPYANRVLRILRSRGFAV